MLAEENQYSKKNKRKVELNVEDMVQGYMEMSDINLEEANAAVHTNFDGMFD